MSATSKAKEKTGAVAVPELMTKPEAASYLNVTEATIKKWTRKHAFPATYITPQVVRYRRADIDAWIEHRQTISEQRKAMAA